MTRPSRVRRRLGRRSVSYLIAVGAVSTVGAMPLLSASPALADGNVDINLTVQAGQAASVTLPGSGNYDVADSPSCGTATLDGNAYMFDSADTSNGRPACDPGTTLGSLVDAETGDTINVNITVTPAPLALPSAPAAPSVVPGLGQLTISWTPADTTEQVDSYQYTIDGGTTWTPGTSPTTVGDLGSGTPYEVGVRSHNATGYGPPSAYTMATTVPIFVPPPPVDPTPTLALPSAPSMPITSTDSYTGAMTITWAAAAAAEQVDRYEYSTDGGATWTVGTSPTVLRDLAMGFYAVTVRAHNASGYGPASPIAPGLAWSPVTPTPPTPTEPSAPTVAPPAAPGRPVVTAGNRSISIAWSAVTGATRYEYTLDGGHSWSRPTTQRSAVVKDLQNGRAYSVRVRALTGSVAGAASIAVSVTPKQPVTPSRPTAPAPATPALPPLQQQGSRGLDVARIQRLLGIPADGIFGPQTAGAVRAFQAARHLQVDGIVGRQTWTALLAGGSGVTNSPVPGIRPLLRFGSTGSYVREAQQRLGGLVVDGIFGARTQAAVTAFQTRHHLLVDGIVGSHTWAALLAG